MHLILQILGQIERGFQCLRTCFLWVKIRVRVNGYFEWRNILCLNSCKSSVSWRFWNKQNKVVFLKDFPDASLVPIAVVNLKNTIECVEFMKQLVDNLILATFFQ